MDCFDESVAGVVDDKGAASAATDSTLVGGDPCLPVVTADVDDDDPVVVCTDPAAPGSVWRLSAEPDAPARRLPGLDVVEWLDGVLDGCPVAESGGVASVSAVPLCVVVDPDAEGPPGCDSLEIAERVASFDDVSRVTFESVAVAWGDVFDDPSSA